MSYKATNVTKTSVTSQNYSRQDIISWVNATLPGLGMKKIEEMSGGGSYCRMMNILFPKSCKMSKVKVDAKTEYDKMNNFKALQQSFNKTGCDRVIEIDRLVKGRFQDNFEFVSWFHKFYDANSDGASAAPPGTAAMAAAKSAAMASAASDVPADAPKRRKPPVSASATKPKSKPIAASPSPTPVTTTKRSSIGGGSRASSAAKTKSPVGGADPEELKRAKMKNSLLEKEIIDAKLSIEGLERERDFYFSKLRDIEVICQEVGEDNELVSKLLEIMYATEDGFEVPEDQDEDGMEGGDEV